MDVDEYKVGFVAIGRNEGDRLIRCIESVQRAAPGAAVVYVDSGSVDGSVEAAKSRGVEVLELDTSVPFTAARARNAGAERLREIADRIDAIQFLDGDCELDPEWIPVAIEELQSHPDIAAVCGRRRERNPSQSVYNAMIDVEWNTPIGDASSCGGDVLIDASKFMAVGGYDDTVIAGEEPEMCVRLRRRGWRIRRIDAEMTRHDADLTHMSQWWKRCVRSGYACALGAVMHGSPPEYFNIRRLASVLIWAAALPVLAAVFGLIALIQPSAVFGFIGLAIASAFPLQVIRLSVMFRNRGLSWRLSLASSTWLVVGKWAELIGAITYGWRAAAGKRGTIIEYKTAPQVPH